MSETTPWIKASASGNNGECVEIRANGRNGLREKTGKSGNDQRRERRFEMRHGFIPTEANRIAPSCKELSRIKFKRRLTAFLKHRGCSDNKKTRAEARAQVA